MLVNELCLRQVKKMQKAENFLKGYLSCNMRKGFFSLKVKSCLGGVKGKMKKSEKDMNRAIQHNGEYVSGNRCASRINGLKGLSSKRLSSVLTAISVVSVFVTVALLMTGTVEAQIAPNPTFVTVNVSPSPTIPADQITIGWVHKPTIGAKSGNDVIHVNTTAATPCLLYTSPSPRDRG